MAYEIAAMRMTLSDLQGHSATANISKSDFYVQLYSSWQDFNRHSASRGPSAIAELLVGSRMIGEYMQWRNWVDRGKLFVLSEWRGHCVTGLVVHVIFNQQRRLIENMALSHRNAMTSKPSRPRSY